MIKQSLSARLARLLNNRRLLPRQFALVRRRPGSLDRDPTGLDLDPVGRRAADGPRIFSRVLLSRPSDVV